MLVKATVVGRSSASSMADGFWREPQAGVMAAPGLTSMECTLALLI